MQFKALSVGITVGFLFAAVPSCSSPPTAKTCAETCDGCCDSSNTCVPLAQSNTALACGKGGVICANCSSSNLNCNPLSFLCDSIGIGGGSGGGSVGGGNGNGGGTGGNGGGSAAGGGGGTTNAACNVEAQNCPEGEACLFSDEASGGRCFPGLCDLVKQDCGLPTAKCTYGGLPDGGLVRGCLAAGIQTQGQSCGPTEDNCAKGLICLENTCQKYCYADSDCTNGELCNNTHNLDGTHEVPSTCIFRASCDANLQNCPSGQGCYLIKGAPLCRTAGTLQPNDTCGGALGDCIPGSLCIKNLMFGLMCQTFCNLDGGMPICPTDDCRQLTGPNNTPSPFGACY